MLELLLATGEAVLLVEGAEYFVLWRKSLLEPGWSPTAPSGLMQAICARPDFQARSPRPSRPAAITALAVSLIFGEAASMTAVTLSCIAAESRSPLSCRKRCAAEATKSIQAIDFDL